MPREITGALGSGETHRVFPGWKVPQKDVDSPSSTIRPQATPSKFPARTSVDPDKMARKCIEKDKDAVTARTTLKKVSKLEESVTPLPSRPQRGQGAGGGSGVTGLDGCEPRSTRSHKWSESHAVLSTEDAAATGQPQTDDRNLVDFTSDAKVTQNRSHASTLKLSKRNRKTFRPHGQAKSYVFRVTPKLRATKGKMNKSDLIKMKSPALLCVSSLLRGNGLGESRCNHTSAQGRVSRTHEQGSTLGSEKKPRDPIRKWAESEATPARRGGSDSGCRWQEERQQLPGKRTSHHRNQASSPLRAAE